MVEFLPVVCWLVGLFARRLLIGRRVRALQEAGTHVLRSRPKDEGVGRQDCLRQGRVEQAVKDTGEGIVTLSPGGVSRVQLNGNFEYTSTVIVLFRGRIPRVFYFIEAGNRNRVFVCIFFSFQVAHRLFLQVFHFESVILGDTHRLVGLSATHKMDATAEGNKAFKEKMIIKGFPSFRVSRA